MVGDYPMILFVNLKIIHNTETESYRIRPINSKIVPGTFKEIQTEGDTSDWKSYLVCSFTTYETVDFAGANPYLALVPRLC